MKLEQILIQLFNELPKYTDFFTDNISVTSLTLSSGIVTATTATPHNLIVGKIANIKGAIIQNPISSLTRVGTVVTAITTIPHDLTLGYNIEVTITGATQTQYNGIFTLLSVPDRNSFTYSITTTPITPATGSIFLLEADRSFNPYNGLKNVLSIPTTTTFTYAASSNVYSPAGGVMTMSPDPRITGVLNIDKALAWYTKQPTNKYWLYVVLGGRSASKDRFNLDDSVASFAPGTAFRQRVITPFSCYVVAPLPDDTSRDNLSGRIVRDNMEDIFLALCKSIVGTSFQSEFSEINWSQVVFVNHDIYDYNGAYYVHQFSFEASFDITFDDTNVLDENVAFRNYELNFQNLTTNDIIASMSINLDNDA